MTTHPHTTGLSSTPTDRDPVCGMNVRADSQHRAEHRGRTYLFCSASCRQKFLADPEL